MAQGRRGEMRQHALAQAMLVWTVADMDEYAVGRFMQFGQIGVRDETLPHLPGLDEKIAEIQANGGKLIVR